MNFAVDENVVAAIIRRDETEASVSEKLLDYAMQLVVLLLLLLLLLLL